MNSLLYGALETIELINDSIMSFCDVVYVYIEKNKITSSEMELKLSQNFNKIIKIVSVGTN